MVTTSVKYNKKKDQKHNKSTMKNLVFYIPRVLKPSLSSVMAKHLNVMQFSFFNSRLKILNIESYRLLLWCCYGFVLFSVDLFHMGLEQNEGE